MEAQFAGGCNCGYLALVPKLLKCAGGIKSKSLKRKWIVRDRSHLDGGAIYVKNNVHIQLFSLKGLVKNNILIFPICIDDRSKKGLHDARRWKNIFLRVVSNAGPLTKRYSALTNCAMEELAFRRL